MYDSLFLKIPDIILAPFRSIHLVRNLAGNYIADSCVRVWQVRIRGIVDEPRFYKFHDFFCNLLFSLSLEAFRPVKTLLPMQDGDPPIIKCLFYGLLMPRLDIPREAIQPIGCSASWRESLVYVEPG